MTNFFLNSLSGIDSSQLNNMYNTNIENNMNRIEKEQIQQCKTNPEYLNQFDDLKFDNQNGPVSINQSNKGINSLFQRNIDFINDYSEFQKNEMHYNVVDMQKNGHNNMVPNTSRRSVDTQQGQKNQRALETFTGTSEFYAPKKESDSLFEPMKDLTWTTGMPSVTNVIKSRMNSSNKNNNGALPFKTNEMVKPGLGNKNQEGQNAVYRINPITVDDLRTKSNQKTIYENKPLTANKKGRGVRASNPVISKFKLPDFREQHASDLVATKSVYNKPVEKGEYTNMETNRHKKENYYTGPGINISIGNGPDLSKTTFQDAKKESYLNDNSRSITNVNNKPVMTNVKSFNNNKRHRKNTQREGTTSSKHSGYTIDYTNKPETTNKELMIHNKNLGITSQISKNHVFPKERAKTTGRMFTSHNITGSTSVPQEKQTSVRYQDKAKLTGKMFTSHNITGTSVPQEKQNSVRYQDDAKLTGRMLTSHNITGTSVPQEKQNSVRYQDDAKLTGRMFTSHNITGTSVPQEKQNSVRYQDDAKLTGRMFTSHNITGSSVPQQKQGNTQYQDKAKMTIKQTTLINDGVANLKNNISSYVIDDTDVAKTTIRQQTENTKQSGPIKSTINEGTYMIDINDKAKTTTKETTIAPTPLGREHNSNMGSYTNDEKDVPCDTIKQLTIDNTYIGGLKSEINSQISHEAASNNTINDTREISTFNRTPNGARDLNGPYLNKDTVELKDSLLYSFVPIPHKSLNQSIMPNNFSEKSHVKNMPIIESSYYVNDSFINTLSNNPYVNNIVHQKNI